MNVVVCSIVASQMLERIPGQCVSAVVVDSLDGGADEEEDTLLHAHASNFVC